MPKVSRIHRFALASCVTFTAAIFGWFGSVATATGSIVSPECEVDQCLEGVTVFGSMFDFGGGSVYVGGSGVRYFIEATYEDAALGQTSEPVREEPACLEEQIIKQDVVNTIGSSAVQAGMSDPPGRVIMYNSQLNDAAFQSDPAWNKWQVIAEWRRGSNTTRYVVVIHYMFNDRTRQATQIKFKNTPYQGCGVV